MMIKSGEDWTFEKLYWVLNEFQKFNDTVFKLDTYPNTLEVISFEQMLDAYSRSGMPIGYDHWQFGEIFVKQSQAYKHAMMGLAYEIVLNSSPCKNYLMEQNTMVLMALVISHAAFGHNSFFKTNYLFREWTDAEAIIDYLAFAKKYVKECEEKYGPKKVEELLDAAHALQYHGIDRYKRARKLSFTEEEKRREERERAMELQLNEVWNSVPKKKEDPKAKETKETYPKEPEENILYFLEKNAPRLETWQREILRIVRKISQYFYPQMQTQVMNEGFATFVHYEFMEHLHKTGKMDDGAWTEFLKSHTGVINQPDYDSEYYSGINVYALGYNMYRDIKRVCINPTEEDREWFKGQDWVGRGDWIETIKWIAANFKDDSFILQFLSPKVIRDLKLVTIHDDDKESSMVVEGIHNEQGYKIVRSRLSKNYDINSKLPNIQIVDVDRWGDRTMFLEHTMYDRRPLDDNQAGNTLLHLSYLWGYPVVLQSIDRETNTVVTEWDTNDDSEDMKLDFNLSDL